MLFEEKEMMMSKKTAFFYDVVFEYMSIVGRLR